VRLGTVYPTVVLVLASLFFAYDIVSDIFGKHEDWWHITVEFTVFLAIILVLYREIDRLREVKGKLVEERSRAARLSGELLDFMQSQFARWGLSPSESDVALLLIRGLSMKEIARARQVKEKTVRQQAASVYAKSGYAGRHELVAHFIEDLMSNRSVDGRESSV
jgi:DNA-binding CsgD family transcriptional regulator